MAHLAHFGSLFDPLSIILLRETSPLLPKSPRLPGALGREPKSLLTVVSLYDTVQGLSKHGDTLQAIFADPVRASIKWSDIESLLANLGATISEGKGSRVRVALNHRRAVFHRPHPRKETDKGAVKSVRRFLTEAGVTP